MCEDSAAPVSVFCTFNKHMHADMYAQVQRERSVMGPHRVRPHRVGPHTTYSRVYYIPHIVQWDHIPHIVEWDHIPHIVHLHMPMENGVSDSHLNDRMVLYEGGLLLWDFALL